MKGVSRLFSARFAVPFLIASGVLVLLASEPAKAQVTAYKQAIAEAAYASDTATDRVGAFYRENGYQPIWTAQGDDARKRRAALLKALQDAGLQGLPPSRYRVNDLVAQLRRVDTTRDLGMAEVALSRAFVRYATDVQSGLLAPSTIDENIDRQVKRPDAAELLAGISRAEPVAFLRALAPSSPEYHRLMKEKLRLERLIADGGWGPVVPAARLEPGDTGAGVIALRDRLVRMGYMRRSASRIFDKNLEVAIRAFQSDHGLEPDGVAGKGTIQQVNVPAIDRLKSIIVAMERERWLGSDRGDKHVLVNQTDFTARIMVRGQETFRTRAVIGRNSKDRRSPEFSDEIEHMIINPSWHVPRSIMTKEYLPKLQQNPNAASHLIITDERGQRVNREDMDFTQFTARNFPFDMRQPPGGRNALGRVKFMFPNKHNVYMHDTPEKHLFKREVRAFSHGCIRLARPFDFAYAILAAQVDDPVGYFQSILKSGRETQVDLDQHIPVHIIYRTAFTKPRGGMEYRRDIYRRDAKIWAALQQAGVALPAVQG